MLRPKLIADPSLRLSPPGNLDSRRYATWREEMVAVTGEIVQIREISENVSLTSKHRVCFSRDGIFVGTVCEI